MKDPDHPEASASLTRFLRSAQRAIKLTGDVGVRCVSNAQMRRLNRRFRGKDKPTDVLSFPASHNGRNGLGGDIAISSAIARANARVLGHSLETELKILLLHGLLHLAGYDHESDKGEMKKLELQLRAKMKLPLGLIERSEIQGWSPLLQQGGAGLQSSGKNGARREGALAAAGSPALKRGANRRSLSGALKHSSPRINPGAPTLKTRNGTAKVHSRNRALLSQSKAHSRTARRSS